MRYWRLTGQRVGLILIPRSPFSDPELSRIVFVGIPSKTVTDN